MQEGWSDATLCQGLRERNPRALEALIARFSREIAYFVKTVLEGVGTAQDVEECVNDLFITAWQDIASFNPDRAGLRTWLTMRAKYVALDRRRQIQRRQGGTGQHPLARTTPLQAEEAEQLVATAQAGAADSLEGILEAREQREQLREALEQLPELDRLLVYLRYFRLATTEEIETKTGLTRRAIDTRLWRARRALRAVLEVLEERSQERSHGQVRAI